MRNYVKIIVRSSWLIALVTILIACEDHENNSPPTTQPPGQIVSVSQAKQMFDSYTNRRVPIIKRYEETIDSTQAFYPTRFGEYDYETIKNYIAFIDAEAALANVEIGGLRFYLTNYPATSAFTDGSIVKYPRQNSFVLVPTTEVDGEQQGFITRTTANGGRTVVLIKDWLLEQNNPEGQQNQKSDTPKQVGFLQNNRHKGSMKPRLLFINPINGIAMPVADGEDISLILNESNLRPPPPDQDTDFD